MPAVIDGRCDMDKEIRWDTLEKHWQGSWRTCAMHAGNQTEAAEAYPG